MQDYVTQTELHHPASSRKEMTQEEAAERKCVQVYSVVMSLRARSSSSLRALPFSFCAYTSSREGHTHTHRKKEPSGKSGNRRKVELKLLYFKWIDWC